MQHFVLDALVLIRHKETQRRHVLANQQHGIIPELAQVNQKFSFYLFDIFLFNFFGILFNFFGILFNFFGILFNFFGILFNLFFILL